MTHGQKLPRISAKLDYIEKEKPRWYGDDERHLDAFERRLDDQIKRIDKPKPKPKIPRFQLPAGIAAAERGQ